MSVRAIGPCVRMGDSISSVRACATLGLVFGLVDGSKELGTRLEAVLGKELVDLLDGLRDVVILQRDRERDSVRVVEDLEHGLSAGHKVDLQFWQVAARLGVVSDNGANSASFNPSLEQWKLVQASSGALRDN